MEGIGLWPPLPLNDPRRQRRMAAFLEVLDSGPDAASSGDGPRRPFLEVYCFPVRHPHTADGGAPSLAQLFHTEPGPLFVAPIVGRFADWGTDTPDDRAPADAPAHLGPDEHTHWGRPADLVCVLLGDGPPAPLRVKCRQHGLARVDLVKLVAATEDALARRRASPHADPDHSQSPVEVFLPDVAALPG